VGKASFSTKSFFQILYKDLSPCFFILQLPIFYEDSPLVGVLTVFPPTSLTNICDFYQCLCADKTTQSVVLGAFVAKFSGAS
jgi:hypothetical protein